MQDDLLLAPLQGRLSMTPIAMVNIYRLRAEHEATMTVLVVSVGIIKMEAAFENQGCLATTRCFN